MTRRQRGNHFPEFKAKVAIAVLKGDKTLEKDFLARVFIEAGPLNARK